MQQIQNKVTRYGISTHALAKAMVQRPQQDFHLALSFYPEVTNREQSLLC
ncbi:MAG: hypothetical protein ACKO5P_01085 [Nodosilinea sp.]